MGHVHTRIGSALNFEDRLCVDYPFYVHIVESPSSIDLLDGFTEGAVLKSFLQMAGIECRYNLTVDRNCFECAMTDRVDQAVLELKKYPILHISCHGATAGIQLTDQREEGALIYWNELAALVTPINSRMQGALGLCLSTCFGGHGATMAQSTSAKSIPYGWIVGSKSNVGLADIALAFSVFYRRLQVGMTVHNACRAAQAASGIDDFCHVEGTVINTELQQQRRGALQRALDQMKETLLDSRQSPKG